MDHDYTHPEYYDKNLIYGPEGLHNLPDEVQEKRNGLIFYLGDSDVVELCRACGWTNYNELLSSYGPRIKIFHTRGNIGLWAIGSKWMIRDQPNDSTLGNDYMTQQFLRDQPGLNIPLIKEMRRLSEPTDKIHFTLMSRAQAVTLQSIWKTLTEEQKLGYRNQLADSLKQLRQFTAPGAQRVDGSPNDDFILSYCVRSHPPGCKTSLTPGNCCFL